MKFCTKCGAPIQEGTKFCTACGNQILNQAVLFESFPQEEAAAEIVNQGYGGAPVKLPKLNLTKSQKLIALISAAVIILCIVGYNIGASLTSKDKVITKFTAALNSKNKTELAKYIVSSDPKVKIDDKSLDAFVAYLDKNPTYKDTVVNSVKTQSKLIDSKNNKDIVSAFSSSANDLFTLKKQGKTMLFYDKYVFELKPVYIKLSTNYKDTQLFVNDNLACTADKNNYTQEVGPYIPGLYKIKAKLNGKYADLEKSVDVDLVKVLASSKDDKKTYTTSVYLDGRQISLSCSYEDAKLFANGKDTGLTIQDAKNFGPIPLDGTVKLYVQKEFPWGTVKGEELAVKNSYVSLKLSGLDDSSKSAVMDTLNSYNKNYINAFNTRDISKLTDLTDKQRKDLKNNIDNFIEFKEMFTGSFTKASYDLDNMNVFKQDGKYYVRAVAQMQLSSAVYSEGTPAPTLSSDTVVFSYTLIYDEVSKKWLVDSEYRGGYFTSKNTKEFTY